MAPHFSFATQSVALFQGSSFISKDCSSVSFSLFLGVNKNYSSLATSEEDVFTFISVVYVFSRILRRFAVTFNTSVDIIPAVVLTEPAMRAIWELSSTTHPYTVHSDGGTFFV